jgi:hypothetical protein
MLAFTPHTPWQLLFFGLLLTEKITNFYGKLPHKMHDPEFSPSQIKFPDTDIFGPNSLSLSENNWIHPSLGRFTQFLIKAMHSGWKNDLFCRQTNQ